MEIKKYLKKANLIRSHFIPYKDVTFNGHMSTKVCVIALLMKTDHY